MLLTGSPVSDWKPKQEAEPLVQTGGRASGNAFPVSGWERDTTQKWYEPKASKFHHSQQPRLKHFNPAG